MNAHNRRVARQHCQSGANTLAARRATRDCPLADGVVSRQHHHDSIGGSSGSGDAPIEYPSITELLELLGPAKALATSARDNNRPHLFGVGIWLR